jgi:DUF2892 family protein
MAPASAYFNEGVLDRFMRIVVGLAILSLTVIGPKSVWALLGIVPLGTGLIGVCPLYSLFHLNTCAALDARSGGPHGFV